MKDIKSLYLAAKKSAKASDISVYTEAIHELLENNPNDYISSLEYIISSDIGVQTLNEFVEKHGLPISYYGNVVSMLEKCIEKCEEKKKDDSEYKKAIVKLESFRQKYTGCFMMESFFDEMLPENYVSTYYGCNESGISNRRLAAGLISKFGEAAIPDVLITADNIGGNAMETALQFIESHNTYGNPVVYEWVLEAVKNLIPGSQHLITLESGSIGKIAYMARNRNHQVYREAVITGNDDAMMEYSENEINAISDFISYNEYKLTWADELGYSSHDIQQEIYSLYEEYEGLLDENDQLMTESEMNDKITASSIVKRMVSLKKKIMPMIKPAIINAVKDNNRGKKILSAKVQYPTTTIVFRDSRKRDKILLKKLITKNIDDIIEGGSEFVDCVELGIRFEIGSTFASHENKSFNLYVDAIHKALAPLVKQGIISFKKSDSYYIQLTYLTIPVYMSRAYLLDELNDEMLESYASFEEFVADSVIPMLPSINTEQPIEEAQWLVNTRNKKTGDAPGYIKKNHNVGYGEDDTISSNHGSVDGHSPESEPTLDDFKRPSAEDMAQSYSGIDDDDKKVDQTTNMTPEERKAINNYYYYTYNNSHNRNTGSFNRDGSTHDDHSTTTKTVDDHSYGKRINSDDISNPENEPSIKESKQPWELDLFHEAVGDADDNRPESDHPVKDVLTDIDRNLTKKQQSAKKTVQNVQNAGRAFVKPAVRTQQWITNMVSNWKDVDENDIKERMADPHARSNLFSAIKKAIVGGSLLKAGLLLNPVFLFLSVTRGIGKNKREFRLRNEMIGEFKTEIEVIDEKIKDADRVGDNKEKYKLMRFKNELNKKLLRVGGPKGWSKII